MSVIDLSKLPPPRVLEELSFEEILAEMLEDLESRLGVTVLVSDPAYKVLEVAAYREMVRRQEQNERIRMLLAAYAQGEELDHIGVTYYATPRLLLDEGDEEVDPPVPPTWESDEDYLRRFLLAPDGWSTAGPRDGYVYHALSADPDVKDATAITPAPTEVMLTVLSRQADGEASAALLETVLAAASAETVRPQTDLVHAQSAKILPYEIVATLEVDPGPDPEVVREEAEERIEAFTEAHHRLGLGVVRDAALATLYVEGVRRVNLELADDVVCDDTQAAFCTRIEVTLA
ncbi:baseplate J-like protein [Thioalkalivibrio sulfidiphilus HL-EbGr7]|uniref:Baseplate J-like protein n=1 Tax=Thioalkalivibrio sulfidiphilus (strain HL-EbGR7) TaxID=396588 RepID=B8GS00_THISH|nr:baseplate J/gp47 family protein [Thioalkalivibrio sulfidiphilus]ACL72704.1 baseplate J-like protein [Thioalkalivibrio sulfidiphilus HL-EbGr7]